MDLTRVPEPEPGPEAALFWNAANESRLLIGSCGSCGEPHSYPRTLCPFCGSTAIEHVSSSGVGEIYSYSTMRRTSSPYALAWVILNEGVGVMTNLLTDNLDSLAIGQQVIFEYPELESGQRVPMARPVPGRSDA